MLTQSAASRTASTPSYLIPFITVTTLFGIFGFLTNLNSNLMPHLKSIFDLTYGQAMLATAAWFIAYLLFSVPSAKVIEMVGYKRTMVISLFIMVAGALLFIPAANYVNFAFFLAAIFLLATGVCGLQTSANPYVSILGSPESAPRPLDPVAGIQFARRSCGSADGWAIHSDGPEQGLHQGCHRAHCRGALHRNRSYPVRPRDCRYVHAAAGHHTRPRHSSWNVGDAVAERSIWSYRHTVLAMVGIFFYVGIEIALRCHRHQLFPLQGIDSIKTATTLASLYFVGIMIGRFLGSALMTWIKANQLLAALGLLGVALLFVSMFSHGMVAAWTLVLCGLANSIMYPNIFALGIAEFLVLLPARDQA